jgi:N-acetylated-alpha-linked acidic dipeptidase
MHTTISDDITNYSSCRVEQLIVTSSLEVDLTSLRQSIQALQAASVRLDTEKAEAKAKLRTILRKVKKRQTLVRRLYRKLRKVICKLAKYIGKECKAPENGEPTDFMFAFNLI